MDALTDLTAVGKLRHNRGRYSNLAVPCLYPNPSNLRVAIKETYFSLYRKYRFLCWYKILYLFLGKIMILQAMGENEAEIPRLPPSLRGQPWDTSSSELAYAEEYPFLSSSRFSR
jgi:hypothetical protein